MMLLVYVGASPCRVLRRTQACQGAREVGIHRPQIHQHPPERLGLWWQHHDRCLVERRRRLSRKKLGFDNKVLLFLEWCTSIGIKPSLERKKANQHTGLFLLNEPLRDHAFFGKLTALSAGSFEAARSNACQRLVRKLTIFERDVDKLQWLFCWSSNMSFRMPIWRVHSGDFSSTTGLVALYSNLFFEFLLFVSCLFVPSQLFFYMSVLWRSSSHEEVRPTSQFIFSRHFLDLAGQIHIFTRSLDDI